MQVTIAQAALARGLAIAGRATSTRSTLPVLACILLSTDAGQVRLSATNLEIGVSCWLPALVEADGAAALPAGLLAAWVGGVPPADITLDRNAKTWAVQAACGRHRATIKGMDAAEFPLLPAPAGGALTVGLPPATLRTLINQVALAAADAKDTSRPALTGVLADFAGNRLTLAATDGYRLALRRTTLPAPVAEDRRVIIPARALQEVARVAAEADPDQPVTLALAPAGTQVLCRIMGPADGAFSQVDLVSQLIDAKYPDYTAIIPKTYVTRAVVDTAALQRTLKVASLFARYASDRVVLTLTPGPAHDPAAGSLAVRATSAEAGDHASEVDAVLEGYQGAAPAALEIAFNVTYLAEALAVLGTPQAALEVTRSDRPGVLRPVGPPAGEESLHVIMPMQLGK